MVKFVGVQLQFERVIEDPRIITHPIRWQILELLNVKPTHGMFMSALALTIKAPVAYHINLLEEHGLVTSEYEVSHGKVMRMITLNHERYEEIKEEIKRLLSRIELK